MGNAISTSRARKEMRAAERAQAKEALQADRTRRNEFFLLAKDLSPYLAVQANGATYLVATDDPHIGQDLFVKQYRKEMRTLDRALNALQAVHPRCRATTFIDVGANIGTSAIDAVIAHGFKSAIAFEPKPRNHHILRLNIALNQLEEAIASFELAISDRDGTVELDMSQPGSGYPWVRAQQTWDSHSARTVRSATLDSLAADGVLLPESVGMLWVDVEGHEAHVLRGASCLLGRQVPIVAELSPQHLRRAGRLAEFQELVTTHYTHILDLRKARPKRDPLFKPAKQIGAVVEEYDEWFTDVLVCNI